VAQLGFASPSASSFPTAMARPMLQAPVSPLVYVYGRANFAAANGGRLAAVADLNGDGWLDFVTITPNFLTGSQNNSVSIQLSQPDGSFRDTGVSYPLAAPPLGVAVGDFNGDGKLDLAVPVAVCPLNSACPPGLVSILLGNGDGTFQPHKDFATGPGCGGTPAVGDFNGDGKLDLAFACNLQSGSTGSPGIASILLGNGDGTFQPPLNFAAGTGVIGVVAGDFNGDGKLDLVVANAPTLVSHTVSLLLGKGDGTFLPPTNVEVGGPPYGVTAADVNGDGRLDLLVATGGMSITVMIGNGDGTFQPPVSYPTAGWASDIVVADMNGDGRPDLVVDDGGAAVSILLGNGDGTFKPYVECVGAGAFAVGDFNRGGKLDVVDLGVTVTLGNGDGTLANPVDYATGNGPSAVIADDFNGDGNLDLAVANFNDNTVSILLGLGNGKFSARTDYATGAGPVSLVAGDFNGDGKLDLAALDQGDNSLSVLLGNGDGTFKPAVKFATGAIPEQVVAGDFNLDGKLDLAVTNGADNTVSILLGNGDGTFQPHVDYATGPIPLGIVTGDFNGDGKLDLAVADYGTPSLPTTVPGLVSILLGNGDGTFRPYTDVPLAAGAIPEYLAQGDFNGDGKADLAVMVGIDDPDGLAGLTMLLGNGDGTFQVSQGFPGLPARLPRAIVASDFNADGKLDVAFSNYGNSLVNIFDGLGDGTFRSQGVYGTVTGAYAQGVAVGDFNGDGYPDMAVVYAGSNTLSVYLSTLPSSTPDFELSSSDTSASITAGQTATFTLELVPVNGFNGTVSMACSGAPAGATCTPSPTSISSTGSGPVNATVTVTTTAKTSFAPRSQPETQVPELRLLPLLPWLAVWLLVLGLSPRLAASRRRTAWVAPGTTLLFIVTWAACGGAGSSPPPPSEPAVSLSASSLTFSSQNMDSTSAAQTVTLTNSGNAALSISGIARGGANPADFAQTSTCGTSVAAGANCPINVTFTPTATGTRNASISITDNAAGSPQSISLTGTGVPPATPPGNYTLTVTATTSNGLSRSIALTLTVQ